MQTDSPDIGSRKILLVAFHLPPIQGSSGVQRISSFCRYLPAKNWNPSVLGPTTNAYLSTNPEQNILLPTNTAVYRALCLDAARHLAVFGRYFQFYALPDRWVSWKYHGVQLGRKILREQSFRAILSSYPIATAHLIGYKLSRITGLPWIADFRDPMVEKDPLTGSWKPSDKKILESRLEIEKLCVENASLLVFTTERSKNVYLNRYSGLTEQRCLVIPNGYEEEHFVAASDRLKERVSAKRSSINILHSGTIYPTSDRNPSSLFAALKRLKDCEKIRKGDVNIILRATGHDDQIRQMSRLNGVEDEVSILPAIPYIDALAEMLDSDALLLLQGYSSNPVVPAKLYEYFRARKPILALADENGATAALIREQGIFHLANLDDVEQVTRSLLRLLEEVKNDSFRPPSLSSVEDYSRENQSYKLADALNHVVG